MAMVQTDDGGLLILNTMWGQTAKHATSALTVVLMLFVDTNTVNEGDGGGSSRVEAAGGGYAAKDLSAVWPTVALVNGIPTATWPDQTFNFTDQLSTTNKAITGYMLVVGTTVVFEEKITPTFTPPASATSSLVITPRYQLGNGTIVNNVSY